MPVIARACGALSIVVVCVCAFVLGAVPAAAALPSEFGSGGPGAGQLREPSGVAVNNDLSSPAFGDVYVTDRNQRVNEFTGEGVFVRAFGWDVNAAAPEEKLQECTTATGCQGGSAGGGAGQLDEREFVLQGIAVDDASEEPLDTSVGDVYVLDRNNGRVEKFDGEGHFLLQFAIPGGSSVAVGPTGTVYVGEVGAVQEYTPEGEKIGEPVKLEGLGGIGYLAVNAASEIYVTEAEFAAGLGEMHPVRRYGATGEPLGVLDEESGGSARALALTPEGDVFVNHQFPAPNLRQIRGFNPAGVQLSAFATSPKPRERLAFGTRTGALYALNGASVEVLVQPERPLVSGESADHLEPTTTVVHAVIGPDAPESCGETHYRVEYGLTSGYGSPAPQPEGALPRSFEEDPVEVPLAGLAPRTEYHYRAVASEECELEGMKHQYKTFGSDETFTTLPPALVEEEFSTDVRTTSATLHAVVNPLGSATGYHFLYGPCGEGECSVPTPDEAVGSGKVGVPVEAHIQNLTAGQTYHYHVIATNSLEKTPGEIHGEALSFTTQTGGEAGLPDHREWELASPPDKHGADLAGISENHYVQAAADGSGVIYGASAPTEPQPHGHAEPTQLISKRTNTSWSSLDLLAPHTTSIVVPGGASYRAFSSDLSLGVLQPTGSFEPALSPEATEQTTFLRDSTTGVLTPFVIGCTPQGHCPANRNDTTDPFIPFGGPEEHGQCTEAYCGPQFEGATPDLSHIVLGHGFSGTDAALLQGAPANSLYEWARGRLSLVSELPPHSPEVDGHPFFGGGASNASEVVTHAVSDDGSRVFWTEQAASEPQPLLFMRDMTRGETIEIGSGAAFFEGANATGTLVFYSAKECQVLVGEAGLECKPLLGENGKPLEDGTILATSEDGSWVYFKRGQNIYIRHGSREATLVASNIGHIRSPDAEEKGILPQSDPYRASPDGEWFAFMSDSPLTGYDNRDAATAAPDEEVYLYSAAAERLVCASCNPTGARPQGTTTQHLSLALYARITPVGQSIAATVPGWAPYVNTLAVYDPRFLSDAGRLFFNAIDTLVPRDVNEQVNVYEYEPPASEPEPPPGDTCTTTTHTGTAVYNPAADGCVALISNGESPEESVFEDASVTGDNIFFLSASRLTPQDLDGSLSMWDAHICTTGSPCPPPQLIQPPPCDTEGSCKSSPTPQPAIYGSPASATFNGPGNVRF